MGAEAACTVRFDGTVARGRALLETDALVFRGDFRLAIPYRDIRDVRAAGGDLTVVFHKGTAVFVLGAKAAVWAEKIRRPKSVLDKLGVAGGADVAVLAFQDRAFEASLAGRRVTVRRGLRAEEALVFLGVSDLRSLARLRTVARRLRPDGAVWVVTPRGSAAVPEARVLAAGRTAGLVDVKVVRFSETHTAHKFVTPVARRQRP